MSRLEKIQNLKNDVSCLSDMIKRLNNLLDSVKSSLGRDEFLENELNANLCMLLRSVGDSQEKVRNAYDEYNLGPMPEKVSIALETIDRLTKEKLASAALAFMSTLKAKRSEIDILLDADRECLRNVDLKELEANDELSKLGKYVDILLAFEEKDKQKRFIKAVPALANKVDIALLYEICNGLENFDYTIPVDAEENVETENDVVTIEPKYEDPDKTVSEKVESEKTETPSEVSEIQETEVIGEVSETEEVEASSENKETQEVEISSEDSEPSEDEKETIVTSEEQVVAEPVLSEETNSEEIVEQDRTETAPETEKIAEQTEPVEEKIDYAQAFVDQDTEIVTYKDAKKEHYTLNKFKIQAKGNDDSCYRKIFGAIDRQGYFMSKSYNVSKEDKSTLEDFAFKQIKLGYFDYIKIDGIASFYVAGNAGNQALRDKTFRSMMGLGKQKKRADIPLFSTYSPFNICSFIKTREYVLQNLGDAVKVELEQVDNSTFSSIMTSANDGFSNVVVVGITSSRQEDANRQKNSLLKLNGHSILVVAGLEMNRAERNMYWILNVLPEELKAGLQDERIICYSVVDGQAKNKLGEECDIAAFIKTEAVEESNADESAAPVQETENAEETLSVETPASEDITSGENSEAVENEETAGEQDEAEDIDVPEECLIEIGDLECDLISYEDKEKKAMTPKEFKKSLGTNNLNCFILTRLCNNGFISPKIIANTFDKTIEAAEFNIGILHKAGLIRKKDYKDAGNYYVLSPKGSALCANASIESLLGVKKGHRDVQHLYDEIKSYTAIAFTDTDAYFAISENRNRTIDAGLDDEFFHYVVTGKAGIGALGCFTSDKEIFGKFAKDTKKLLENPYVFCFVGWTKEHAKALAQWAVDSCEGNRFGILYKVVGDNTVYDMDDAPYEKLIDALNGIKDKASAELEKNNEQGETDYKNSLVQQVSGAETEEDKAPKKKKNFGKKNAAEKSVEETEEEAEEIEAVEETEEESFVLTNPTVDQYIDNFNKMLTQGKIYAACAYLKALSDKNKNFEPLYKQLAYAAGDPLGGCTYTSDAVRDVFFSNENYDEHLLISAALRTLFLDLFNYDHAIPNFQRMLLGGSVVDSVKSLGTLITEFGDFKTKYKNGLDHYADYHQSTSSNVDIDKCLQELRQYAHEQYEHYIINFKEDVANKRLSVARKLFMDKNGEAARFLRAIMSGEDRTETIAEMRQFLQEKIIKDGALVREENIDYQKIDDFVEECWQNAADYMKNVVHTSDLMSSMRTKFNNQIDRLVKPMCRYISLHEAKTPIDNEEASHAYKVLRSKLLKCISESISALEKYEAMNIATVKVLKLTLEEIRSRLDGTYKIGSEKYFYLNFLKTDNILLDEHYLPYLQDVEKLPAMSAVRRIEQHLSSKEVSFEKRAQSILEREDNYTSLECILQYLDNLNEGYSEKFRKEKSLKLSMENAALSLDVLREEFDNEIELRQSYGQIDETEGNHKEELITFVDYWYEWAKETRNYGFFRKVCELYVDHIDAESLPRAIALGKRLGEYKEKHPEKLEEENVDEAIRTIEDRIRIKNFTAAEDLLNRLERNELMAVNDVIEFDYLNSFISNYSSLYQDVINMHTNLKEKLLKKTPRNMDGKAAARIAEAWITSPNNCVSARVKELLESLDFNVASIVSRPKIGPVFVFDVTLAKPMDGRKVKYKHPIAAFGSMAESDAFKVAYVFGNYETQGLLNIYNTLGDSQDILLFVDGAMNLSTRRTLARKTKETTSKIFAVVDRVVLAYLTRFYKPASVQKMLMNIVIPFAYMQPYTPDSNIMAPEMFIGREHELNDIESASSGVNLVYGGRQLGKSALLRMAQTHVDKNDRNDRAVYVDINTLNYEDACRKVSLALQEEGVLDDTVPITSDWAELAHNIKIRLKSEENRIPYLLLLLDEADKFIATSAAVKYKPIEDLRDISNVGNGRFKFVLAGLRDVIRFDRSQSLANNLVLTKLGKITVRPFDVNEARILLERPLSYLGLRFAKDKETEALISSIFGSTNYFPGLLQLYCRNLVQAMQRPDYAGYDEVDTPPYDVSVEHIKRVLGGSELQSQIREKFFITLGIGKEEDSFYYIIALLVAMQHQKDAENSDVTPAMLLALARNYGVTQFAQFDEDKAFALMEELCELNILHNTGNGYRFTRYSFYQMMGTESHIEEELLKVMVEG